MMSTCAGDDSLEVVDEDLSESVPGADGVWGKRVKPQKLWGLQSQRKVGNLCGFCAACHLNCLGVDPKPLVWGCLTIVLTEADWLEAFGVDMQTDFASERGKSIAIIWGVLSFLNSSCFLSSIDDLPGVASYSRIIAEIG